MVDKIWVRWPSFKTWEGRQVSLQLQLDKKVRNRAAATILGIAIGIGLFQAGSFTANAGINSGVETGNTGNVDAPQEHGDGDVQSQDDVSGPGAGAHVDGGQTIDTDDFGTGDDVGVQDTSNPGNDVDTGTQRNVDNGPGNDTNVENQDNSDPGDDQDIGTQDNRDQQDHSDQRDQRDQSTNTDDRDTTTNNHQPLSFGKAKIVGVVSADGLPGYGPDVIMTVDVEKPNNGNRLFVVCDLISQDGEPHLYFMKQELRSDGRVEFPVHFGGPHIHDAPGAIGSVRRCFVVTADLSASTELVFLMEQDRLEVTIDPSTRHPYNERRRTLPIGSSSVSNTWEIRLARV
jgi:hypothetical protein